MFELKTAIVSSNNKDSMSRGEELKEFGDETAEYNVCDKGFSLFLESKINQLNKLKDSNDRNMVLAMLLSHQKQMESLNNDVSEMIKNCQKTVNDNDIDNENDIDERKRPKNEIIIAGKRYLTEENVIVGSIATWYAALLCYFNVVVGADIGRDLSDCGGILLRTKLAIFAICTSLLFYLKYDEIVNVMNKDRNARELEEDDENANVTYTFGEVIKLKWKRFVYSLLIWILFFIGIDTTIIECTFGNATCAQMSIKHDS